MTGQITLAEDPPDPVEIVVEVLSPDPDDSPDTSTYGPDPVDESIEAAVFVIGGATDDTPDGIVTYTAGENLSGHRVVVLGAARRAYYADPTNPVHLARAVGVTTGAAVEGDSIAVRHSGVMVESSWSWNADMPIYVGADGNVTQAPLTAGDGAAFVQRIGYAPTPTSIVVDLSPDPIRFT